MGSLWLNFYFRLSIARFLPNIFAFICCRKIQCQEIVNEKEPINLDHLWAKVYQIPSECFWRRESQVLSCIFKCDSLSNTWQRLIDSYTQ